MKGQLETLPCAAGTLRFYVPPCAGPYTLLYACAGANMATLWAEILQGWEGNIGKAVQPFVLAWQEDICWNRDFSPWYAPPLHPTEPPFAGGGVQWLHALRTQVLPGLRQLPALRQDAAHTGIIGYSLGGLAALWALHESNEFGLAAGLSPSLWYPGMMDYFVQHPLRGQHRIYLSLGKAEEKTRHPQLRTVGECTREAAAWLAKTQQLQLQWNNGNHFYQVPQRFQRALQWLLAAQEKC